MTPEEMIKKAEELIKEKIEKGVSVVATKSFTKNESRVVQIGDFPGVPCGGE